MESAEQKILSVARQVRAKFPKGKNKGSCLTASHELMEKLLDHGFNASIQFGWFDGKDHSWTEVMVPGEQRMRLLDITVDQFGDYPAILWSTPKEHPEYVYDTR